MKSIFKTIIILLIMVLIQGHGSAGAEIVEKIVAVVNDEVILLSELEAVLDPLRKQLQAAHEGEEFLKRLAQAKNEILDKMIETKILTQEARSRSVEVSPQEVNVMLENVKQTFESEDKFKQALKEQGLSLDDFSRRLEDQIRIKRLVDQEVRMRIGVDIEEMRKYYEENRVEFFHGTKYRVKHILIKDSPGEDAEKRAGEALARIKAGEDFSILAKEYSEDPSASSGGDLGFLEEDKLIPEIRETLKGIKIGEVSDVIKTRLGYQIIKVEAIKEAEAKNFDKVNEEIRQKLFQEKFAKGYQEWLNKLKENSYIYIKK